MKHKHSVRFFPGLLRKLATLASFYVTATIYANAQIPPPKLTTIHEFSGGPSDGNYPLGGGSLVGGPGTLYGMTNRGGAFKGGTVYTLVPPAAPGQPWTETILHNFAGGLDGQGTEAVLIGSGGALYGTTFRGGAAGYGTAFSLTPPATQGGPWSYSVIYNFQNRQDPSGPLAIDANGVIYGTSETNGSLNTGVVYALYPPTSTGGPWAEEILHTFNGVDGGGPTGVVIGSGGVLYGTALDSDYQGGLVYSLTPPLSAGAEWTFAALAYLKDGSAKLAPAAPVVIGAGGVLYGTTANSPLTVANDSGAGLVFSLTPPSIAGGAWTYQQLYEFTYGELGSADGAQPSSPLVIGAGGVLYGVTPYGGLNDSGGGSGTIFSVTPPSTQGGAWTESVLYRFTNEKDGIFPGCVILSNQGLLYGVSDEGEITKAGAVWEFTP